jgi:uncharacterized tellurite resistance protein B-like protein
MVKIMRDKRLWTPIAIGVLLSIFVGFGAMGLTGHLLSSPKSDLPEYQQTQRAFFGGAVIGVLFLCVYVGATSARWIAKHPNAQHPGRGGKHEGRAKRSRGLLRNELEADMEARGQAVRQLFNTTLRDTLMFVVGIDGDVNESEVARLCEIYKQVTDIELDMNGIRRQCQADVIDPDNISRRLHVLSDQLQPEGKAVFIQAALFIAAADEEFDVGERAAISFIAAALDMTQEEFDAAVRQLAGNR